MATVGERIQARLKELTAPVMEELAEVELAIKVHEEELKELREGRQQLLGIARRIDPSLAPPKEKKKESSHAGTSPEMVEKVESWLRDHIEEVNANGGVYASGLIARPDFPKMSQSVLSRSLSMLHEQGVLRLDHTGSGGSKFFKVVA